MAGCAASGKKTRDYADRNLIRVDWTAVHHEEIIARVKNSEGNKQYERMCISRISHPDSHDDIFVLLERWVRKALQIPASILFSPTMLVTVPGADARSGRGYHCQSLNGVSPETIDRTRGRCVNSSNKWGKSWCTLE